MMDTDSTSPVRSGVASRSRTRARLVLALILVSSFTVVVVAAAWFSAAVWPFWVRTSLEGVSGDVDPNTPIAILSGGLEGRVESVALYRLERGADDEIGDEQLIPVKEEPAAGPAGAGFWTRQMDVHNPDGSNPLAYGGHYRLHLVVNRHVLAAPLPEEVVETRDYFFSTPESPVPSVAGDVVELDYRAPLQIRWSVPVDYFAVEVEPEVAVQTRIDPVRRDISYVDLLNAQAGARYRIRLTEARGLNGAPLASPFSFVAQIAPPPVPLVDLAKIDGADRVIIPWDVPIKSFGYEIAPAVQSVAEVDPADATISRIKLVGAKQGATYEVTITAAVGTSGSPLAEPSQFTVDVPKPLDIQKLSPRGGAYGVKRDTPIGITFTEAVGDRAQAEAAISISPPIDGHFEWLEPNRLQFVPDDELPPLTKITVGIQGGLDGVRGASGAYLDEPWEYTILTQPDKLIDVDLTRQVLVLYEDDTAVYTTPVATGVRGAETPAGDYMVLLKWPTVRMTGVNPSGTTYDIPNVPWVMSFFGDYTLHGAPWRSEYGYPQSNGCVSMGTAAAKHVYDWAPLGTPVRIHY